MGDPARDASSDPDTVETECARGSRLPRIVGGEEELGGPSLAPEQCACEMKGVEPHVAVEVAPEPRPPLPRLPPHRCLPWERKIPRPETGLEHRADQGHQPVGTAPPLLSS